MRVLKNEKYNSILQAARAEFIRKGFKDSSMRDIARNARVGLGNIYNYFGSKDEIFRILVKPAKEDIFRFVTERHTAENVEANHHSTFGHFEEDVDAYIDLVINYKQELHLLLYQSEGSSMQDFRECFIEHLTQISYQYIELEKKVYPHTREVSHFFIRTLSSWMVSIIGDIITHDLDKPKIREFFREYFRFEFAGWQELTGTG